MSEELVNQITLNYLMNKTQYEKYIANKTSKTLVNEEEKKTYRKRIYALTKELLLNKDEPTDLSPDVKSCFDQYMKSCIHYFKILDSHTMLDNNHFNNEVDKTSESEKEEDPSLVRSIPLFHPPNLDTFLQMNNSSSENINSKNKSEEKEENDENDENDKNDEK